MQPIQGDTPYRQTQAFAWRATLRASGLVIICLVLTIFLYKAALIWFYLDNAYASGRNFATIVAAGLTTENWAMAQQLLTETTSQLQAADENMGFFAPLLQHLQGIPYYGQSLAALPLLLHAGDSLGQLAQPGLVLAKPLLLPAPGTTALGQLPMLVQTAEPALAQMQRQMQAISQQLAPVKPADLRLGLAEPTAGLQALVTLLTAGLQLRSDVLDLLGIDAPRTYLLLAQNNHELRGTGGFITSIGRLTVAQGQIISLDFVDSYAVDHLDLPHPAPPPPMQRYMQMDVLMLRDVNWSPDLATTARLAQSLYLQNTGHTVDGVITLDLQAVALLVGALAPLNVLGVDEPITQENFIEQAKALWAAPAHSNATLTANSPDWWKQRKDFIPLVAKVALERIKQGDCNYLRVANALQQALNKRAIQLWIKTPSIAAKLAQLHWDGSLHPLDNADFLALVDSNFGYNKVNAVVERAIDYQVAWPGGDDQRGLATVTVTYRHPLQVPGYVCDPRPHYELTYDEMMARCFFDFVRLYVPAGSELTSITGVAADSVINQHGEAATQIFGGYFVLEPGLERQVIFQYRLPANIQPDTYRLVIQRQSGTPPFPLQLRIGEQIEATTIIEGWQTWQPQ